MVTKAKANSVVSTAVRRGTDGAPTHIDFTVAGVGTTSLELARIHPSMRAHAELHGWVQRGADGAAKARDGKTFKSATPQQKFDGISRIVDHYNSGTSEWKLRAERPDASAQDAADTILALTRARRADGQPYARDVDEANAIVAKWATAKGVDRDAAIKAWLTTKTIASAVADIRAERARAAAAELDVDVDAMMEELEGGSGSKAE